MTTQQPDDGSHPWNLVRELLAAWALVALIATVVVVAGPGRESERELTGVTDAVSRPTCGAPLAESENDGDRAVTLAGTDGDSACSSGQIGGREPAGARSPGHPLGFRGWTPIDQHAPASSAPIGPGAYRGGGGAEPASSTRLR